MESVLEREKRIARLESERSSKRAAPVEIAPGRGDLNKSSTTWYGMSGDFSVFNDLALLGNRTVSFTGLFQTQPWVAAAVMRMLTWSVRVPLKVYRRTGEDSRIRLLKGDHPLATAIAEPWERGYMAALVQHLLGPMLVHGNSLIEVEEGARGKLRFIPKDWRYSIPIRPFRDSVEGFKLDVDQASIARSVSIDSLIHCAWWTPVGPIGTSPLQQLGVTLRIEDAAQRYQQGLFRNGARPASAITASDEFLGLDRDERQVIMGQLRQDITDLYAGPDNGGRPALLPPGLDWKPIGSNAEEAVLIEQRKIARDEIAAVYMIPPPMLGNLDKATYSNIEVQREMIYTDALGPPLVLLEQAFNSQVVWSMLREDDIYVEFDFAGALRGDRLKEVQSLREAIASALLTPNEGRTVLNMPKSDNPMMDEFYLTTNNLSPIGTAPSRGSVEVPATDRAAQRMLHVRSKERDYSVSV